MSTQFGMSKFKSTICDAPTIFFLFKQKQKQHCVSVLASTHPFKYGAYSSLETM